MKLLFLHGWPSERSSLPLWFEWRRWGLGLPIVVGLMILFLAMLIAVGRHNSRLSPDSPMRSPMLLLTVPLFAAALVRRSRWPRWRSGWQFD